MQLKTLLGCLDDGRQLRPESNILRKFASQSYSPIRIFAYEAVSLHLRRVEEEAMMLRKSQ